MAIRDGGGGRQLWSPASPSLLGDDVGCGGKWGALWEGQPHSPPMPAGGLDGSGWQVEEQT